MPRYAVKVGEIYIRSDKPITEEDRKRITQSLERRGHAPPLLHVTDDLTIHFELVR